VKTALLEGPVPTATGARSGHSEVLTDLDREFERRGLAVLRLRVNERNSAVARPWERKFLGLLVHGPAQPPYAEPHVRWCERAAGRTQPTARGFLAWLAASTLERATTRATDF
jgi:hypothetical protein